MKIINLDELEEKCVAWGIKHKLFTKEHLKKGNLFTINFRGSYQSKTFDLSFSLTPSNSLIPLDSSFWLSVNNTITLSSNTWEDLYYKINDFFRSSWDYTNPMDLNKAPVYMQITEELKKKSINGVVKLSDVHKELVEKL